MRKITKTPKSSFFGYGIQKKNIRAKTLLAESFWVNFHM